MGCFLLARLRLAPCFQSFNEQRWHTRACPHGSKVLDSSGGQNSSRHTRHFPGRATSIITVALSPSPVSGRTSSTKASCWLVAV